MITNYKVVAGLTRADLAAAVLASIGDGWQPYGAAAVFKGDFLQPMTLGSPINLASFEETELVVLVPVTTDTVTLTPDAYLYNVAIEPAGTIAALTLNIAAGTRNGQQVRVAFKQIVTSLTCGANLAADGLALPTAAAVNNSFLFAWSIAKAKWERIV